MNLSFPEVGRSLPLIQCFHFLITGQQNMGRFLGSWFFVIFCDVLLWFYLNVSGVVCVHFKCIHGDIDNVNVLFLK